MAFIYQENLDSQVNGSQTVFTLDNNISLITSVIFDGGSYIGVSAITGVNQITLADAPTTTLRISYYTSQPSGTGTYATVQDAIDRFKRQMDDSLPDVSTVLYLDWLNDLNYMCYEYLCNVDPEKYIQEIDYNITSSTDSYALPNDIKNIRNTGLSIDGGCGFFEVDSNGNATDKRLNPTGFGSTRKGYYLKGNTVIFTPFPTASSDIKLRYIPLLSELTSTTDELVISKQDLVSIINWLDKNYGQWNDDFVRELNGDQRFIRSLPVLLKNAKREPIFYTLN